MIYNSLPKKARHVARLLLFVFAALRGNSVFAQENFIYEIVSTGQSLAVGINSTYALTTYQPFHNKMLAGAGGGWGMGPGLLPLMETGGTETPGSAMANTITAGLPAYEVVVGNSSLSGSDYQGLMKGTPTYKHAIAQVKAVKKAADSLGKKLNVIAVTTIHGETDNRLFYKNGPVLPGSVGYEDNLATYKTYLMEWQRTYQTDIAAITGQQGVIPLFTDQMSSFFSEYGKTTTSSVPMSQLAAAEENPGKIYLVGPKYFFAYSDLHHLTEESYQWLGEYYGKVIKQVVVDHIPWRPLGPDTIYGMGNTIYAVFHVPAGYLVFDTANVLARPNNGFEFTDSSAAAITSVALAGTDTVIITLNHAFTGHPMLRYAYTGTIGAHPGAFGVGAAAGNLRDTDPYPSLYGHDLYNWCVQFDKSVKIMPAPETVGQSGK